VAVTTLLLARHGETDWNREGRFQGHADPPLNDLGRAQARELADRLERERLGAIYASPLRRAYETAEIVGSAHGLAVRSVSALREVDVGSWSGLTRPEIESRFPAGYRRWLDYGHGWDDGETYAELAERVVPALLAIAARDGAAPVLAVTHGGPIRAAVAHAAGVSIGEARRTIAVVENCGVVQFAVEGGRLRIVD
jgi:probable phosphoglycerate mutase